MKGDVVVRCVGKKLCNDLPINSRHSIQCGLSIYNNVFGLSVSECGGLCDSRPRFSLPRRWSNSLSFWVPDLSSVEGVEAVHPLEMKTAREVG